MGLLQVIRDAPGYAKVTLQGPQGSGKTRTAVEIAATVHRLFQSARPIAFFDTETGSDYVADLIAEKTRMDPLRVKTRAFADLMDVVGECVAGAADVLIVDSITHVWRELNDAYMLRRRKTGRMAIDDIMAVKQLWYPWPDAFLNSPLHILVCGREGSSWGHEVDEETGKRQLVETGKKMRVEGEFGYEASLMIAMAAVQTQEQVIRTRNGRQERRPRTIVNVATVLKDRFDAINGEVFEMPTGDHFLPHLERLHPPAHRPVDTTVHSDRSIADDPGFGPEKRQREILCEEIQGLIAHHFPGQTAPEKKTKADLVFEVFGTRSWTKVEGLPSARLQDGLEALRRRLGEPDTAANGLTHEPPLIPAVGDPEPATVDHDQAALKAAGVNPDAEPDT